MSLRRFFSLRNIWSCSWMSMVDSNLSLTIR